MTNERFFGEHPTLRRGTTTTFFIDGEVIEYWVNDNNDELRDMTEVKCAEMKLRKVLKKSVLLNLDMIIYI